MYVEDTRRGRSALAYRLPGCRGGMRDVRKTASLLHSGFAIWALAFVAPFCADAAEGFALARAKGTLNGVVRQAERRDRSLSSVGLFAGVYSLLRANTGLDKLDILLDTAAELQDRAPASRGYGNFRWYVRDGFVMDFNAVDFCMQEGALVARDFRDRLTSGQRAKFDLLCELAIQGCLNHRVCSSYTNIALMNAVDLILLGEAYGRKDAFDAGMKRLDEWMLNTAVCGVCEYSSPTYTAVDINCLLRLHRFARDKGAVDRADRLLRLFWSDVAASSFTPSGRLAGAHSRDYDYLFGGGAIASYMRATGLAAPLADRSELPPLALELSPWRPDAAIRELAARTPRTVVARWGERPEQVRAQWTGRHVALGIAGANYGNMDIPLAIDFASAKRIPRVYFIADGRRDPYGRKKIPAGNHQKTLHLRPFWAGVQRGRDALGLVAYRSSDIPDATPTLESHIVFPCDVDEVRINDEPVPATGDAPPFVRELAADDAVFVRLGAGACAVRVPWTRDRRGGRARVALVRDGAADVPAFRLTVAHHDAWGLQTDAAPVPGAAFWVRVTDDASTPLAFDAFRTTFRASAVCANVDGERIEVDARGTEGPLVLAASAPFFEPERVVPQPPDAVLAVDGRDIGREILGDVPGLAEYRAELARIKKEADEKRILVQRLRPVRWEAENGTVKPKMRVERDNEAIGGAYVWTPGEPGGRGGGPGSVSWLLEVKDPGSYRLWGRVFAPTPEDDSFTVSAYVGAYTRPGTREASILPSAEWHLGAGRDWRWCEFPVDLALPRGPAVLMLRTREDGAKIDSLLLTGDSNFQSERDIR